MTQSIITTTLTPAQFAAARALASAHFHLWGGVPEGTYDLDAIRAWSESENAGDSFPGIEAPEMDGSNIVHTTGTGRLTWTVERDGDVTLQIFRPAQAGENAPLEVARVQVINDNPAQFEPEMGLEVVIHTSSVVDPRDPSFSIHPDLRDDLLFERHVKALVRPLVALITANAPRFSGERYDAQGEATPEYQAYREEIIQPAIENANIYLQHLYEKALPDPSLQVLSEWYLDTRYYPENAHILREEKGYVLVGEQYYVIGYGGAFPVESERVAVHAALLLKRSLSMPLIEAVRQAILGHGYRP